MRVVAPALVVGGVLLAAYLLRRFPVYRRATDLLFSLGHYEAALATCERAIALDSGDSLLQANRGTILAMLGREEEALASFARVCELAPAIDPLVWMNYATTLRIMGRTEVALPLYERALLLQPTPLQAAYILAGKGSTLVDLDQFAEARGAFAEALRLLAQATGEADALSHAELFAYLREAREKTLDSLH